MQFITSLFGGSGNTYLTALFALGAVIVLILLGVWLLKLLFRVSSNGVRGRNKRLAIVDSLMVDQKRQLLIVRRDNVEHLILMGGNQDLVVESGIVPPEPPAAQTTRRPVPMIGRKANNDVPPAPAKPAQATTTTIAGPGAAIDRAREANKAREQAPSRSLRHTVLLRPVSTDTLPTGYKPDISPASTADSATENAEQAVNESVTRDHEAQGESSRN